MNDGIQPSGVDLKDDKTIVNLTDEQIGYFINIIREKIPLKPTTHNLPYIVKHPGGMEKWGNNRLEDYCTEQINQICNFVFLPPALKVMFVTSIYKPAIYTHYDGVHLLSVNLRFFHPNVHCASISREITCYYLKLHNIILPDIQYNKYLIDVAIV